MSQPEDRNHDEVPPLRCPYCGATLSRFGPFCWMCRAPLTDEGGAVKTIKNAKPPQFVETGLTFSLASLMAVTTLIAVGVGLAMWKPGLGILFGFISVPALIITVTRTRSERQVKGRNVSLIEKVFTFVLSSLFVVCMMVGCVIAGVIALFAVCWMIS